MRRFLIAGNWKMNTDRATGVALAREVAAGAKPHTDQVDVLVCPPFPYLAAVVEAVDGAIAVGAQNCYHEQPGAFTGETSIEMLKDVGCQSVLIGHSERRHVLDETDQLINQKVLAAQGKGLQVVLCVGELLAERQANQTETVLDRQMEGGLANLSEQAMADVVIAYEPVWAIGTGHTATPDQAQSAHAHLRKWMANRYSSNVAEATRILYGGSVKPANAQELLQQPDVDGALVGGASLSAADFVPIIEAAVQE